MLTFGIFKNVNVKINTPGMYEKKIFLKAIIIKFEYVVHIWSQLSFILTYIEQVN